MEAPVDKTVEELQRANAQLNNLNDRLIQIESKFGWFKDYQIGRDQTEEVMRVRRAILTPSYGSTPTKGKG